MKSLLMLVLASVPAAAGTLESDAARAAAPFEGLAAFAPAPVMPERETGAAPRPAAAPERAQAFAARPDPAVPAPAPSRRPRTFDDGFMDGFGFVEWPAVAILDANMSCRTGLCEGNAAVGAFGYGLGVLLMPVACVAGLATSAWWAVFG